MMIYLVRHTTPDIAAGVCYGQSDVPLASSYIEELATVRRQLPTTEVHYYSSPLERCLRLARDLSPEAIADDRLLELNFGDWELQRWDAINQPAAAYWGKHFVTTTCPHGESYGDLQARVLDFWQELLAQPCKNIVVITHAGPMRAIMAHILNMPLRTSFDLSVAYGQVVTIDRKQNKPRIIDSPFND